MKTKRNLISFFLFIWIISSLVQSCATTKPHYDDAVRIKKAYERQYNTNPFTKEPRNGSSLRGKVLGVSIITQPDSCPIKPTTEYIISQYVLFVDSSAANEDQIEKIPLNCVELIGYKLDPDDKDFGKINIFEDYHNPLKPDRYRFVKIDSTFIDTCSDCGCNKLDIALPELRFKCPKRNCSWYFLELRGVYSIYNDVKITNTTIGRDNISAEIAAGFRFGESKKFGLGVAVSNGIKAYDSKQSIDLTRPSAMLHLRYDFLSRCNKALSQKNNIFKTLCLSPFVYGQIGGMIDSATINLFKLNFSADCKNKLNVNGELPGFDLSIPISYTLGAGIDIPLVSWMDLSADVSFRSYAVGEMTQLRGYTNVPVKRTINMLVFRFGVTF
ncbi:MAG: hypothetical protein WCR42_06815 [bacterium]